ncbi:MAG: hypothetical protein ACPLXA_03880 [Moorellaceae bacterium]
MQRVREEFVVFCKKGEEKSPGHFPFGGRIYLRRRRKEENIIHT